jgi:glycosyltransferase involved in cell wall biosynthesis
VATILAIEPWYGETHRYFLESWQQFSVHQIICITLPARKWKWRLRAGSLPLAEKVNALRIDYQGIMVSDYVNLAELSGLINNAFQGKRKVSYFHENQLTYPVQNQSERDYAFTLANMMTMASSDTIVWNTSFHMHDFLSSIPSFIERLPAPHPPDFVQMVKAKSLIIPVGIDFKRFDEAHRKREDRLGKPLRILWPHRWEHDKNPDEFFQIILELYKEGLPFELTILGRRHKDVPPIFNTIHEKMPDRIITSGFVDDDDYPDTIAACDVVVSTAIHENQGIAVIEAIRAGCDPLLPGRLSYPEILPATLHEKHLYKSSGEMRRILRWMMRHPDQVRRRTHETAMDRFDIRKTVSSLDSLYA